MLERGVDRVENDVIWQYWVFNFLLNFMNIELEVIGQPELDDTILAPWPHTSHIDHLLFLLAIGSEHFNDVCMVYKGEYWEKNALNRFAIRQLVSSHSLGVDANSPIGAKKLLKKAKTFHGGIMILPQGSRDENAPLQEGLYWLADKTERKIQPIILTYHGENPLQKGEALEKTVQRALLRKMQRRQPLHATVEFLRAYDPLANLGPTVGTRKEQGDARIQQMMAEYTERVTKSR